MHGAVQSHNARQKSRYRLEPEVPGSKGETPIRFAG